jgi:hypothetical protein
MIGTQDLGKGAVLNGIPLDEIINLLGCLSSTTE